MKRIFASLFVISVLLTSMALTSVFAIDTTANANMIIEAVETASTVDVTLKVKGPFSAFESFTYFVAYDNTKVSFTSAAANKYVSNNAAGGTFFGWSWGTSPGLVTPRLASGIQYPAAIEIGAGATGSAQYVPLAAGAEAVVATFSFDKLAGADADDNTVYFSTVRKSTGTKNSVFADNAITTTYSTGNEKFGVKFTNYEAPATKHTVTYNGNGSTGGIAPTQPDVAEGAPFTAAANTFTKDGYTFEGWSTAIDTTVEYVAGTEVTMGTDNIILYAVWKEVVVTNEIAVTINGNGKVLLGIAPVSATPVTSGNAYPYNANDVVRVTAYPAMGYVISGATYDGSSDNISIPADGGYYDVTVSGSKALVITFSLRTAVADKAPIPQTFKKLFKEVRDYNGKSLNAATSFATKPTVIPADKTSIISYGIMLEDDAGNPVALFDGSGNPVNGYFESKTIFKGDYQQYGIEFVGLTAGKTYTATSYVQYGLNDYAYGAEVTFTAGQEG